MLNAGGMRDVPVGGRAGRCWCCVLQWSGCLGAGHRVHFLVVLELQQTLQGQSMNHCVEVGPPFQGYLVKMQIFHSHFEGNFLAIK
jgi:hypothetical protein